MKKIKRNNVKQEQIHDLLFNREIGWQEIIYDLINTEQLDPWDVNITILTDKYLEKVKKIEGANFVISSKVLLAASLLLRIKSEILLNKYVKSIDEILKRSEAAKRTLLEITKSASSIFLIFSRYLSVNIVIFTSQGSNCSVFIKS